jgi:hypothetical protein
MGIAELIAASCLGAASVSYGPAPLGVPSIRSGRVTANLAYYLGATSMDGRVNQSDVATIHVGRPSRIIWTVRGRRPSALVVRAERLGGSTRIVRRVAASSTLTLPAVGCWRLTVRSGRHRGVFVVQAVAPPAEQFCEPSPVYRSVPHPRFGDVTWLPATPRRSQIAAVLFVSTLPDVDRAVIYAGGRAPEGWSTKFLWWSPRSRGQLELVGRRLDGTGSFRHWLHSASSTDPPVTGDVYPSIVNIPTAGCWGITLRSPGVAGFAVFQAVVTR